MQHNKPAKHKRATLKINMNPEFITTTHHLTSNPTRSQTYTVDFFDTQITTVVTSTPAVARQWVNNLRYNYRSHLEDSTLVVGLGVQWRPTFSRGQPTAATLQLCVLSDCLIFQLNHANSVPATLCHLLEDDRVAFVGVHNVRDANILEESSHGLRVRNLVDLAPKLGYGNMSMENICAQVLGFYDVVKPEEIGLSDWDDFWLSVDQVQYACVDAHIAFCLAVEYFETTGCKLI